MKRRFRFAFDFAWLRLAYGTILSRGGHNSKTPGGRAPFERKSQRPRRLFCRLKLPTSRRIGR
jgi:hypothetical protein